MLEVALELIGCVVTKGSCSGVIVETEAYHECEPACHAHAGLTTRTAPLFGAPGRAYVYQAYGIHAMLNAVCETEGVGAAVLIRALSPLRGIELMRMRREAWATSRTQSRARAPLTERELCSGPGRLTQALGIDLRLNATSLSDGPVRILTPAIATLDRRKVLAAPRIGITKARDLPWRFALEAEPNVSRPWPRPAIH